MTAFLSFLFLTASFFSLWIRKDPKIWGSLLGLSLLFGFASENILGLGLFFLMGLAAIWFFYAQKPKAVLFLTLIAITFAFKLHVVPGYQAIDITPRFHIGLEIAILGLFPLALLVPLSRSLKDWSLVLKGFLAGCAGIGVLAILATATGATHWAFKMPTFMAIRLWSNLVLTSIPEEGYYRGFLQRELCRYFQNIKGGNLIALLLTSMIFTAAHIYWSPSLDILGFVFLASLLYGGVYLYSGKIESAIFCHFLLNLVHMTFFNYHAM